MDIPRNIEKRICRICGGYTFKPRPAPDPWAYCTVHQRWARDDPEMPPPGERSCGDFYPKHVGGE